MFEESKIIYNQIKYNAQEIVKENRLLKQMVEGTSFSELLYMHFNDAKNEIK